ncbi:hypothetical protein ABL78_6056 [Leptomonas seymouri]|uniref:Uncharacterized protein n=1 Tax=Leptomonas seymouri TaxID=5684 RepID=A0A0N1I3Y6_LEPSE|nr:hypothetical protein ABL78_6056 [Leptomonas seymouri]|eukprot:KPI84901.1 hypothetical protein ABL78_6056 [Leptomonas seymouri]
MSQRPPRLAVMGKGIVQVAEHKRRKDLHAAGPAAAFTCESKTVAEVVDPSGLTDMKAAAGSAKTAAPLDLLQPPQATPAPAPQPKKALSATTDKEKRQATVVTAAGPTQARRSSSSNNAIELSLVRNLKRQIACLEAQLRVIKQQQDAAARLRVRKAGKLEDQAAATCTADVALTGGDERHPKGLALPLPHAQRVHHVDATAEVHANSTHDIGVSRLQSIPEAYQLERSALLHNVESLTKDIEGLQSLALDVGRERDVMAAEIVQYRAVLRELRVEHEAVTAECAATLMLLESERGLRRAAEDCAAACAKGLPKGGVSGSADLATVDAVSQRDYYKLQIDRLKTSVAREKARAESLSVALLRERGRASAQEKQLCSALDHITLMEMREHQLAAYYQSLSSRFVTVSAMLRHVLDVVPEDLLHHQRIPSPQRADSVGGAEDAREDVTLGEVRETLVAWEGEALTNAAQLKDSAAATAAAQSLAQSETAKATTEAPPSANGDDQPHDAAEEHSNSRSRTSAPDILAVATVATFARSIYEAADVLKPVDAVDKGPLALSQQGTHVVSTTGLLASAPPPSPTPTPTPTDAPQSDADDAQGEESMAAADAKSASGAALSSAMRGPPTAEPSLTSEMSVQKYGGVAAAVPALSPETMEGTVQSTPVQQECALEEPASTAAPPSMGEEDDRDCAEAGEAVKGAAEAVGTVPPPVHVEASLAVEEALHDADPNLPSGEAESGTSGQTAAEDGVKGEAALRGGEAEALPPSCSQLDCDTAATAVPKMKEDGEAAPSLSSSKNDDETEAELTLKGAVDKSEPVAAAPSCTVDGIDIDVAVNAASSSDTPTCREENTVSSGAAAPSSAVDCKESDRAEGDNTKEDSHTTAAPTENAVQSPPPPVAAAAASPPPQVAAVPPPPPATVPPSLPSPPPVIASIPAPFPPGGVAVPLPPGCVVVPQPPGAMVPTAVPPSAPAPPTLEEQLADLDARIEAQNASLSVLVQQLRESA